ARWTVDARLDVVIAEWTAQLDAAAARVALPDRAAFADEAMLSLALTPPALEIVALCARLLALRLANSGDARAREVLGFISDGRYTDPPPIRAWLGTDLLEYFDVAVHNQIAGRVANHVAITTPVLASLPQGLTPHDVQHLRRNAQWNYQLRV